jgi:lysophospholipase L1-like esterase
MALGRERRAVGRARRAPVVTGPAVGAVVALLLVATGRWIGGVVLGLTVVAVMQVHAVAPVAGARLDHSVGRAARAVGAGLGFLLLGLVQVVVLWPAALLSRLFTGRWRTTGWQGHDERGPSTRPFARDPRPTAGAQSGVLRVVGVLTVLVLLDLALGAALTGTGLLPGAQGDVIEQQTAQWRATMASPAIVDEPWAERYTDDLLEAVSARDPVYVPYLVTGYREFHSPYINMSDRERLSYEPDIAAGEQPLRIAFFGGSALFGLGQRDEHTIPSEFARLAEGHGVPVEVHNYGVAGWVAWQELHYFERLLAADEQYDLVVFVDGFNDVAVQDIAYSPEPTHFGAPLIQQLGVEYHREHSTEPGLFDGVRRLLDDWGDASGTVRILDALGSDEEQLPPWEQPSGEGTTEQRLDATFDIYGRALRLVEDLAEDHDVPVRFYWQPRDGGWPAEVTARIPDPVVDLSDVFAGVDEPVFIDAAHTNELGARVMAEALWDDLARDLDGFSAQAGAG